MRLDQHERIGGPLRQLFASADPRETDPDVRSVLANVLYMGLRQCGAIGLIYANEAFARIFEYESADEVLRLGPTDLGAHSDMPSSLLQVPDGDAADARDVVF